MLGLGLLELLPHQYVPFGLVGEEQRQLGAVGFVLGDVPDELQHGSDAGAAGYHVDLGGVDHLRWLVAELLYGESAVTEVDETAGRASDVDRVTYAEGLEVLGHLAAFREFRMDVLEVDLK